jgi:peroxiredoxin
MGVIRSTFIIGKDGKILHVMPGAAPKTAPQPLEYPWKSRKSG